MKFTPALKRVSDIVEQKTGIVLGPSKALMIQTRLLRRFHQLKIQSEDDYLTHLDQNLESETEALISLMTTHTTEFFREFPHFEYLLKKIPELIELKRKSPGSKLRVWSAACSRGHEVYSLAMFLSVHWPKDIGFEILGTDIDPESVGIGQNGVYAYNDVKQVPVLYMSNNWTRGTGDIADFVRAKKHLRDLTQFAVANLLNLGPHDSQFFDIIFCRNVFIYFQTEQVESACRDLLKRLHPHGLLFVGMSESLQGLPLEIESPFPAVYQKKGQPREAALSASSNSSVQPRARAEAVSEKPIQVLCVDDSPSILSLMARILVKDQGFEIVGTAKNGLEAMAFLKANAVDVITLDIHMPEMNGVEFLQATQGSSRPPVVMVSSVSREDSDLGLKALSLGAVDYVEKPSLGNLTERGEELRMKLKIAKSQPRSHNSREELAQEFSKKFVIWKPEQCAIGLILVPGDLSRASSFLKTMPKPMPPVLVLLEGPSGLLPALTLEIQKTLPSGVPVQELSRPGPMKTNAVYVGTLESCQTWLSETSVPWKSILISNRVTPTRLGPLRSTESKHVLVEEGSALRIPGARVVPITSLSYHAIEFLSLKTRAP